ncbi:MAG: terminase small subunit [Clostridia bacterium]
MSDKLTVKQIRFCQEYIVDLNGTQAAIRAGYSENSAQQIASELLSKPVIQEYVQDLLDQRAARTKATADFAISEIYHLISFDPNEVFNEDGTLKLIKDIPRNIRKAISSIEVDEIWEGRGKDREQIGETKKIKFWDKTRTIELLSKHLKLLSDKHEFTGPGGTPLLPPAVIFQDKEPQPDKSNAPQ